MSSIEPSVNLKLLSKIDELLELQQFALEYIQESIFFVDINARFTYVNRAACTYLGYTKEELMEMSVLDIDPTFTHDIWRNHWEDLKKHKHLIITTTQQKKDGTIIPVEINANYFEYNGTAYNMAFSRDISEREKLVQSEKNLYQTSIKLEALISTMPDMIWMKDVSGKYLMCNPAFEGFFGTIQDNIIGKTDYDFFTAENADVCKKTDIEAMAAGTVCISEETIHNPMNGSFIVLEVRKAPVYHPDGTMLGVLGIGRDISVRKEIEKKIEYMAHHDALTGLPNRTLAKDRMEQAIVYAKRHETISALLFIDLDGFKAINDTLGHSIGDAVLQSVARRLKECIREGDTLSRQGGDEFLLILSDSDTINDIKNVAEKLIHAFDEPFNIQHHPLLLSASIGIAVYPEHGINFEALQQSADTAMYKAKESGKNTFFFYSRQMDHNQIGLLKLQNDLRAAMVEKQFVLHYQPQIDLAHNRIIGAEALIRWKHPELGMIPPMRFIPIAESSSLIVQIGQWVIEEACVQAARWQAMGIEISVAVNISAIQFKRGDLVTVVSDALAASQLPPRWLELEITESIMMQDIQSTLKTIDALKGLGVQLSIDDFGTGYSSLAYLKRFAVDKLKIDQSFVCDILQDKEDAIIVKTITQMAKNLNLRTIAEGVETQEVLTLIESFGCDEVQGYHFAEPLAASDIEEYYRNYPITKQKEYPIDF